MAPDRFNYYGESILTAIRAVNTSIQKTQSYIDANTFTLGEGSVVEIAGASGAIGGVAIDVELQGSVAASSTVLGDMKASHLMGASNAASGATATLVVPTNLVGSVSAVSSTIAAPLRDFREALVGLSTAASGTSAAMDTFNPAHNVAGSSAAVSSISGDMTVSWSIAGSSSAVSLVPAVQLYINGVV